MEQLEKAQRPVTPVEIVQEMYKVGAVMHSPSVWEFRQVAMGLIRRQFQRHHSGYSEHNSILHAMHE